MNKRILFAFLAATALAGTLLWAANTDSSSLASGKYTATLTPAVGTNSARQITEAVRRIQALDEAKVDAAGNSIHFSVRTAMKVSTSEIDQAIQRVAPGVSLGTPIVDAATTEPPLLKTPPPPENPKIMPGN